MTEQAMHVDSGATGGVDKVPRGRTRTCVGCACQVDTRKDGGDLLRLILGEGGEIAVDTVNAKGGGGFGRGAYVHARRPCLERAAKAGLLRATKGKASHVADVAGEHDSAPLSADALARAIERSMDRRIEGLLATAVRTRQVVIESAGSDAALVVVACDAGAAADQAEVRAAVAGSRAVAWGTKERLGAIVAPSSARGKLAPLPTSATEGIGVLAVTSPTIGEAVAAAVRLTNSVSHGAASGPKPRAAVGGAGRDNAGRDNPSRAGARDVRGAKGVEPPRAGRDQGTRRKGRRGSSQRPSGVGSNVERGE
jgi:predicted RNA-binding protein YlxR (DUF448 family)